MAINLIDTEQQQGGEVVGGAIGEGGVGVGHNYRLRGRSPLRGVPIPRGWLRDLISPQGRKVAGGHEDEAIY
jgi:hypothetical protein